MSTLRYLRFGALTFAAVGLTVAVACGGGGGTAPTASGTSPSPTAIPTDTPTPTPANQPTSTSAPTATQSSGGATVSCSSFSSLSGLGIPLGGMLSNIPSGASVQGAGHPTSQRGGQVDTFAQKLFQNGLNVNAQPACFIEGQQNGEWGIWAAYNLNAQVSSSAVNALSTYASNNQFSISGTFSGGGAGTSYTFVGLQGVPIDSGLDGGVVIMGQQAFVVMATQSSAESGTPTASAGSETATPTAAATAPSTDAMTAAFQAPLEKALGVTLTSAQTGSGSGSGMAGAYLAFQIQGSIPSSVNVVTALSGVVTGLQGTVAGTQSMGSQQAMVIFQNVQVSGQALSGSITIDSSSNTVVVVAGSGG